MIYINLLTHLREELFVKQLPKALLEKGYVFHINSKEDIVWDCVIVYEDIDYPVEVKCRKGGLVFYSGEPPMVKVYSANFLNQYDHIITSHRRNKHKNVHSMQQSLPWYYGFDYNTKSISASFEEIERMPQPRKERKISFITSNREFLPGHASRMKFVEELQKRYANEIDFFGKGIRQVGDKADAINPYYFSICIENSSISHYWTEKIADAFMGYAIPIYNGCSNISEYFSSDSFVSIDIKNRSGALKIIENIIEKSEEIYHKHKDALIKSRQKLLYTYNIFPAAVDFIESFVEKSETFVSVRLIPSTRFTDNMWANKCLRYERMFAKLKDKLSQ